MNLPDAEGLFEVLVTQLRSRVTPDTGIVGIVTGGAWLAERLHRALGVQTPLGVRDDFSKAGLHHQVKPSQIPFEVEGRCILLVDDVLFTGRTVRGAMNELFDYGRPARIELAVLVDRGRRELPIEAQCVGASFEVPPGKVLVLDRAPSGALSLAVSDKRRERKAKS